MEQAHHWMWKKRKEMLRSHFQASMNSFEFKGSWEEKAFAEDAAGGALGGCIWPPRSYSCSFCKREFRSAQALGGHMNVHRRDRARLKQSVGPHHTTDHVLDQHNQTQFSGQISASDHSKSSPSFSASTLSLSRVSDQHEVEKNISREEGWVCKRAKTSVPLSLPLVLKPISNGRYSLQSEGYYGVIKGGSMEDLDLELRLGDPPKVK